MAQTDLTVWESHHIDSKTLSETIRDQNYKELQNDTEHLCETQQLVFNALLDYPEGLCDKQIHNITGLPVSSVCGRRNELVKMGLIVSDGKVTYPDYRNNMKLVTRWRISL